MAATVTYATIDGELVYENRGGVETYYVPDTQGSLIECHDATGAITYEAWYWPYGEIRSVSGSKANSWGYIGLLGYLADTSLSLYVRARYYLPSLARWQTVDPLWPRQKSYAYCNNKPSFLIDPNGLFPWNLIVACGSGILAFAGSVIGSGSVPNLGKKLCGAGIACFAGVLGLIIEAGLDSICEPCALSNQCIGGAIASILSTLGDNLCSALFPPPCETNKRPDIPCKLAAALVDAIAGCLGGIIGGIGSGKDGDPVSNKIIGGVIGAVRGFMYGIIGGLFGHTCEGA